MRYHIAVILGITAVLLSGCAVPTDSSPRKIKKERVPFDLLQPAQPPASDATPVRLTPVRVYLVSGDRLVAAQRAVVPPVQLGATLAVLAQGPTDDERVAGISTKLKPTSASISARLDGGIARLDVGGSIEGLAPADQTRAIAQLVFTATELEEVASVQFESGNQLIPVYIADGSRVSRPIQRSDFASIAPM